MNVRFIPATELKTYWGFIRCGLDRILSKSPEQWIAEDVYAAIVSNQAALWLFETDRPIGFTVIKPEGDDMFVWCVYGCEGGYLIEGMQHIEQIARAGNAKRITFGTYRRGWDKVAPNLGFKPWMWAKELK